MLAASMGLEQGPAGMKKLTVMMKKGQIGMKELFNFLDMAAKRAKESGAYDLAINSKQASENRMKNSYELFSKSFMDFFDNNIKGTFQSLSDSMKSLTEMMDAAKNETTLTGMIGDKKTQFEYILYIFKSAGEGLMLGVESLYNWSKAAGFVKDTGSMQEALADREVKQKYFQEKGAKTEAERAKLAGAGYPGIDATIGKAVGAVGGDQYYKQQYLEQFRQRNPIPTTTVNMGQEFIDGNKQAGSWFKALLMQYGVVPNPGDMGFYTKPNFKEVNFNPSITVLVDGVAIPKESIDAHIANAFGNLVKPL